MEKFLVKKTGAGYFASAWRGSIGRKALPM
jgi:hypothetical protein